MHQKPLEAIIQNHLPAAENRRGKKMHYFFARTPENS